MAPASVAAMALGSAHESGLESAEGLARESALL